MMTWLGSTDLQESPDSPEIIESIGASSIVRRYEGPYAACVAAKPKLGTQMSGYPGSRIIDRRLTRLPGERGRLAVSATLPDTEIAGTPEPAALPVLEINWVRLTRVIEQHPLFEALADADIRLIKEQVQNPKATEEPVISSPLAKKLYDKLMRGQDSYDLWVPVVRRISESVVQPITGNAGFLQDPPISPGGTWKWLKTDDSAIRQNRLWTRTEEWTGADKIDRDIYP